MELLLVLSSAMVLGIEAQALQRIAEQPKTARILKGTDARLRCRVEHQAGAVQWTKDGFGLGTDRALASWPRYAMNGSSADGEYHLEIVDVELDDDAEYRCQMGPTQDQKGVISKPSQLVVLVTPRPPEIVNFEDLIHTVEDRAFTVTCSVGGGKPAPEVSWVVAANSDGSGIVRKFANVDGTDPIIEEQMEEEMSGITSVRSSLRYSPQRDDDAKFLVCVAKHETVKDSMAAAAMLNVEYSPRVSVSLEKGLDGKTPRLQEGAKATLLCKADAKPADAIRYAWKRDGEVLSREHRAELEIAALQPFHHEATFECEASNEVGTGRGNFLTTIRYGPRMPADERLAVDLGETVTLSCGAEANPPPTIRWTRVGAPSRVLAVGANLTLPKLAAWQAGAYVCEAAVPGFPKAATTYTVHINGPPRVLMVPVVEGAEGAKVEIICDVRGFPFPSAIDWAKGGRRLDLKENPTYSLRQMPQADGVVSILSLSSLSQSDFDVFNCSAGNRFGAHSASSRLLAANPFPLYIMIPCLVAGAVLLCTLILCIVLCSRRSFCSAKSSQRSGDSHSDVTVKVEALDGSGVPMNSYYAADIYSPANGSLLHPADLSEGGYGKFEDYLPVPQDNPDLDPLPPPYTNYGIVGHSQPSSSIYHYGNGGGPPPTSTFSREQPGDHLVHLTYVDDRQLISGESAGSPVLFADQYGNVIRTEYPEAYASPQQYWMPQHDPNAVYYPSSSHHNGAPLAVLEPLAELPTPSDERSTFRGGRPGSGDQSSPTTQISAAGSSAGSDSASRGPILSGLDDSGLPPSSLNSTNV